jgi:uncharacterized protein (DUF697 family)
VRPGPDQTRPYPAEPPRQPGGAALNPVVIAWAANMAVTLVAAFGLKLTRDQVGAVQVFAAAAVAVATALTARPWYIPGITGAAAAVMTGCAAFGLRWTPEQVGLASSGLSLVLMLLTHQSVIPAAAARRGLTGTELLLARQLARQAPAPARRRT